MPETEIGRQLPELQIQFGCVAASEFDQPEQAVIELGMGDVLTREAKNPDEAILAAVARDFKQVADAVLEHRAAERGGEVPPAGAGTAAPADPGSVRTHGDGEKPVPAESSDKETQPSADSNTDLPEIVIDADALRACCPPTGGPK